MIATETTIESKTGRSDVLTVKEAAQELGVSEKIVYAGVKSGLIPKLALPGRLIRIPRAKFEQYKRGELDERGEPRRQPTERQKELLKGSKEFIRR